MLNINLESTALYKQLKEKEKEGGISSILPGLAIIMSGDASEFLEYIRCSHPEFTSHNLQHSWRIVNKIGSILSKEAIQNLSSLEIFSLITASAFHDVGMVNGRERHAEESADIFDKYATERLHVVSEYSKRLKIIICFVMKSHAMTWEEMSINQVFMRDENVADQFIRTRILCILLRLGDLLDLDSDRSCDALYKLSSTLNICKTTELHHTRHKHVQHYNYNCDNISCNVESHSKEEHEIWSEWFGYIDQEILHANTYIFKDSLTNQFINY